MSFSSPCLLDDHRHGIVADIHTSSRCEPRSSTSRAACSRVQPLARERNGHSDRSSNSLQFSALTGITRHIESGTPARRPARRGRVAENAATIFRRMAESGGQCGGAF